jgi:hypothetical protein
MVTTRYKIESLESDALGLISTQGTNKPKLPLEQGQIVPSEFKVGDEVIVSTQMIDGFYEVKHATTGVILRILHTPASEN